MFDHVKAPALHLPWQYSKSVDKFHTIVFYKTTRVTTAGPRTDCSGHCGGHCSGWRRVYTTTKIGPDPIIFVKKQLTFYWAKGAYSPAKTCLFLYKICWVRTIFWRVRTNFCCVLTRAFPLHAECEAGVRESSRRFCVAQCLLLLLSAPLAKASSRAFSSCGKESLLHRQNITPHSLSFVYEECAKYRKFHMVKYVGNSKEKIPYSFLEFSLSGTQANSPWRVRILHSFCRILWKGYYHMKLFLIDTLNTSSFQNIMKRDLLSKRLTFWRKLDRGC